MVEEKFDEDAPFEHGRMKENRAAASNANRLLNDQFSGNQILQYEKVIDPTMA